MRQVSCALLVAAVCGCGDERPPTQPLEMSRLDATLASEAQYEVVALPSLGGTASYGVGISNRSWVAGWSDLEDGIKRAALWRDGSLIPLGTLGGPNSSVPWPGLNERGMVVGISHTAEVDPLNEGWSCEVGAFLPETDPRQVCRGFVWIDGVMRELPTLGGTHGFATGVNNRGQVVGWAETDVHDPTCTGIQVLQFRAVLWEPLKGTKRQLPPLPGDSTSAAVAINERGQVVGISGDCDQAVGRFSARHAVLWERGTVSEIPNLGGTTWHTPMDINERGDVVGFSNPAGPGDPEGGFIARGFFWKHGSATVVDLGVFPGDVVSQGMGINNRGQVVGVSFGGPEGELHPFLWEDGMKTNLNDLVDIAPDVIIVARHINDRGQITGRLIDHETGEVLAFVATPKGRPSR